MLFMFSCRDLQDNFLKEIPDNLFEFTALETLYVFRQVVGLGRETVSRLDGFLLDCKILGP